MIRFCLISTFFLSVFLFSAVQCATKYEPNWKSLDARPLPAWYDKAKIGIFIHWGLYSVPAFHDEWFMAEMTWQKDVQEFMKKNYPPGFKYEDFAPQFTAEFFDPNKWVDIFVKSGAKYVVLTSKHHDGYALYPSKYAPKFNSMEVGPKRDIVGELAKAVRAKNLTFGLYHSLMEWFHPKYLADKQTQFKTQDFVKDKVRPETEELINAYKPSLLWSDGDFETHDTYWNSTDFLNWLYNESPVKEEVVVNDRWGNNTNCKHGGYFNCKDRNTATVLPEHGRKWENAMTIDYSSWGYRRNAALGDYMHLDGLLNNLIPTIAFGGNLLINIGPTKDGMIIPLLEERLTELGDWLKVNGEAIYESKVWKHQHDSVNKDVYYTERAGSVYGLLTHLWSGEQVEFGDIPFDSVKSVSLLGFNGEVTFTKKDSHTLANFPRIFPWMQVKTAFVFKFALN